MQIGFGIGLTFPLKPGEGVEVPEPAGDRLLMENGTDALLMETGSDVLLLETA